MTLQPKNNLRGNRLLRLAFFALLFAPFAARPQDTASPAIPKVNIPRLPSNGADVNAFVPQGWGVEWQATGDLNKDGKPDLLFVLQDQDPKNVLPGGGSPSNTTDTNPRILAVAFANANGHGYTLAVQNSTLIPRYSDPTSLDPLTDPQANESSPIAIARGAFSIYFQNTRNGAGGSTFTFRFQHDRFELIGWKTVGSGQGTIETDDYNYSTGREITTIEPMDVGRTKTTAKTFKNTPAISIDAIGDQGDFYPAQ